MIDFKEYLRKFKEKLGITDLEFEEKLCEFLIRNSWFGFEPVLDNDKTLVTEEFIKNNEDSFKGFALNYYKNLTEKKEYLLAKLRAQYPKTYDAFIGFSKSNDLFSTKYRQCVEIESKPKRVTLTDECMYYLTDFFLYNLAGEIDESSNLELKTLIETSYEHLIYGYQLVLVGFTAWLLQNRRTVFNEIYLIENKTLSNPSAEAYSVDEYLNILYHLFNEEYINENNMYVKAAQSKNYVDTWLSLSIYFLNPIRSTDATRIPHPILIDSPEETLQKVIDHKFSDAEALKVLNTILYNLELLGLTPNKTKRTSKGEELRFLIPHSIQPHVGRIFAIAEAHHQLTGNKDDTFIKKIFQYKKIKKYMGEEIGELFRNGDFRVRSANKSFLQAIEMMTASVLGTGQEDSAMNGLILASYARSHKSGYGQFASVTSKYLRDQKMSGKTPEFTARELLERGVLSSIPSMLLDLVTNGEYGKLSATSQTDLLKLTDINALEAENLLATFEQAKKQSTELALEIYNNVSNENILNMLHIIANDGAASKMRGSMCLLVAMGKSCPNEGGCAGCKYEIGTVSTLIAMKNEAYRLQDIYKNGKTKAEKLKAKQLACEIVLPSIQNYLSCYENIYGKDELYKLELILKEH